MTEIGEVGKDGKIRRLGGSVDEGMGPLRSPWGGVALGGHKGRPYYGFPGSYMVGKS